MQRVSLTRLDGDPLCSLTFRNIVMPSFMRLDIVVRNTDLSSLLIKKSLSYATEITKT